MYVDIDSYLKNIFDYPLYIKPEALSNSISSTPEEAAINWYKNAAKYINICLTNNNESIAALSVNNRELQVFKLQLDLIINNGISEFKNSIL